MEPVGASFYGEQAQRIIMISSDNAEVNMVLSCRRDHRLPSTMHQDILAAS